MLSVAPCGSGVRSLLYAVHALCIFFNVIVCMFVYVSSVLIFFFNEAIWKELSCATVL